MIGQKPITSRTAMRKKERMGRILGVALVLALIGRMLGELANEVTVKWRYFIPTFGSSTLISLEPGQAHVVAIDGACSWNLQ